MMWRYALVLVSSFVTASVMALTINSEKYLASLPEGGVSVKRENNYWVASYCPDNTCDLLHISTSVKEDEAKRLALGFFIYFSGYTYLSQWQEEARRNEAMQSELQLLSTNACQSLHDRKLVECRFKELSSKKWLKIFTARFDEGKKTTTRLRLSDVFKSS